MPFETIIYEELNAVAIIKLNRTKVLNAMNIQMWQDLARVLDDIRASAELQVVIMSW